MLLLAEGLKLTTCEASSEALQSLFQALMNKTKSAINLDDAVQGNIKEWSLVEWQARATCRISLEMFSGRSLESTTPLMKCRYRGMRLSSNSSLMNTRLTYILMFFSLLVRFCRQSRFKSPPLQHQRFLGKVFNKTKHAALRVGTQAVHTELISTLRREGS